MQSETFSEWCLDRRCNQKLTLPVSAGALLIPPLPHPVRLRYRCPKCGALVARVVREPYISALIARGVIAERIDPLQPSPHPDGPPLTLDDLLDLVQDLARL